MNKDHNVYRTNCTGCEPPCLSEPGTTVSPPRSAALLRASASSSLCTFSSLRFTAPTLASCETLVSPTRVQLATSADDNTRTFSPPGLSLTQVKPPTAMLATTSTHALFFISSSVRLDTHKRLALAFIINWAKWLEILSVRQMIKYFSLKPPEAIAFPIINPENMRADRLTPVTVQKPTD